PVYSGVTNSRFLHSIGTVAAAQAIISAMASEGPALDVETGRVIRVVALLHDIGHVPFAHLLEDEAGLYSPRHDAPARVQPMLDSLGPVVPAEAVEVLLSRSKPDRLYIQDVVSNTIC